MIMNPLENYNAAVEPASKAVEHEDNDERDGDEREAVEREGQDRLGGGEHRFVVGEEAGLGVERDEPVKVCGEDGYGKSEERPEEHEEGGGESSLGRED